MIRSAEACTVRTVGAGANVHRVVRCTHMPKPPTMDRVFRLRLSREDQKRIELLAAHLEASESHVVRRAVREMFERLSGQSGRRARGGRA